MSAFSVENPHDGKMFENYTRFEWGVEVGVVTIFILRLFVPHEFDMMNEDEEADANDLASEVETDRTRQKIRRDLAKVGRRLQERVQLLLS